MINFSTGAANAISACNTANIKRVYSSRRFVELGKLGDMVDGMNAAGVQVLYLEDIVDLYRCHEITAAACQCYQIIADTESFQIRFLGSLSLQ